MIDGKLKSTPEDLYAIMRSTVQAREDEKKFSEMSTKQDGKQQTASEQQQGKPIKRSWIDDIDAQEEAERVAGLLCEEKKSKRKRVSLIVGLCVVAAFIIALRLAGLVADIAQKYDFKDFVAQFLDNSVKTSVAQGTDNSEALFGGVERKVRELSDEEKEILDASVTPLDEKNIAEGEISTLLKRNIKTKVQQLSAREQQLRTFEALLKVNEDRLKIQQDALNQTKGEVEGLLDRYENAQEGEQEKLTGIFSSIQSKKAARIFNNLDIDIALSIIARMPPRKTAEILGNMNPVRARLITEALATGVNPLRESNINSAQDNSAVGNALRRQERK